MYFNNNNRIILEDIRYNYMGVLKNTIYCINKCLEST